MLPIRRRGIGGVGGCRQKAGSQEKNTYSAPFAFAAFSKKSTIRSRLASNARTSVLVSSVPTATVTFSKFRVFSLAIKPLLHRVSFAWFRMPWYAVNDLE